MTAETDGFSYYTVEFTYDEKQYVMNGNTTVLLSEILRSVGLTGDVTAVSVSNESLFSASDESGEWVVTAHQAFTGKEWMKVTIDGVAYEITVTDEQNAVASVTNGDTTTTYSSFDEAITAWTAGTTLTLLADIETEGTGGVGIAVSESKTLDLNGKTVRLMSNASQQRVIQVTGPVGTVFTLKDSSGTNAGRLTGVDTSNNWSGALWIGRRTTVNMYGGTISGNNALYGAGVWIDGRVECGTFNMYGGVITGNSGTSGAGVYVGCQIDNYAGTSYFNMYGGTISGNTATNGSNVYVDWGILKMEGGTIDGGFMDRRGRYVTVFFDANGGSGTMSDQYVQKNTATTIKKNGFTAPTGDAFNCWNTQADGNGTSYAFVPDGTKDDEVATAKDPTYQWRKNSDDSLLFVIKSASNDDQTFAKFTGNVWVDGDKVDSKYITAAKGSLRLTLKPEYLNTLSVGEHTLTVQFDDGTVTHKFMILPASAGSDSPGTGENGVTIALNCLLLVISAAGAVYAVFRQKKSVA